MLHEGHRQHTDRQMDGWMADATGCWLAILC